MAAGAIRLDPPALGRVTRVNAKDWTLAQRVLAVGGALLLALALERLLNAAMLRGAETIAIALGFSVAFGLMGGVALTVVVVMRLGRRKPQ
jgi:hypothetical protein